MNKERYKVGDKVFLDYQEAAEYKKNRAVLDHKCSDNFLKIYLQTRREPKEQSDWEYLEEDSMNEQFFGQG